MYYLPIWLSRIFKTSGPENDVLMGQKAHVTYQSEGPGGYVVLHWAGRDLSFWYEFAGGSVVATVHIGNPSEWEHQTGTAPELRDPVVEFVAKCVIRDQAPGSRYRLENGFIVIY